MTGSLKREGGSRQGRLSTAAVYEESKSQVRALGIKNGDVESQVGI